MALESDSLGALNAYALKEREKNQNLLREQAAKKVTDYEAELAQLLGSMDAYQKQGTQSAAPLDPNDPMFMQKLQAQQQRQMVGSQFRLPGDNSLDSMAMDPNFNPEVLDWASAKQAAEDKLAAARAYAADIQTVPGYQKAVNEQRGGRAGDLDAYMFGAMQPDSGIDERLQVASTRANQADLRGNELQRRDQDFAQSLGARRGQIQQQKRDDSMMRDDEKAFSDYLNNSFADYLEKQSASSIVPVGKDFIAGIRSGSSPVAMADAATRQRIYGDLANSQQGGRFDITAQIKGQGEKAPTWGTMSFADWREQRRKSQQQQQQPQGSWMQQGSGQNKGWGGNGGW